MPPELVISVSSASGESLRQHALERGLHAGHRRHFMRLDVLQAPARPRPRRSGSRACGGLTITSTACSGVTENFNGIVAAGRDPGLVDAEFGFDGSARHQDLAHAVDHDSQHIAEPRRGLLRALPPARSPVVHAGRRQHRVQQRRRASAPAGTDAGRGGSELGGLRSGGRLRPVFPRPWAPAGASASTASGSSSIGEGIAGIAGRRGGRCHLRAPPRKASPRPKSSIVGNERAARHRRPDRGSASLQFPRGAAFQGMPRKDPVAPRGSCRRLRAGRDPNRRGSVSEVTLRACFIRSAEPRGCSSPGSARAASSGSLSLRQADRPHRVFAQRRQQAHPRPAPARFTPEGPTGPSPARPAAR